MDSASVGLGKLLVSEDTAGSRAKEARVGAHGKRVRLEAGHPCSAQGKEEPDIWRSTMQSIFMRS